MLVDKRRGQCARANAAFSSKFAATAWTHHEPGTLPDQAKHNGGLLLARAVSTSPGFSSPGASFPSPLSSRLRDGSNAAPFYLSSNIQLPIDTASENVLDPSPL